MPYIDYFYTERPIRSYELLADVQASWLKDKTVNFFILRLTPLANPLDRNVRPGSNQLPYYLTDPLCLLEHPIQFAYPFWLR